MSLGYDSCVAGACTRLEMALDRPVLWCGCRHHIYELVAKDAWKAVFPEKHTCPGENLIQDYVAADRPELFGADNPLKDCIEDFRRLSEATRSGGKSVFPRGDYEEFMELLEVWYKKKCFA